MAVKDLGGQPGSGVVGQSSHETVPLRGPFATSQDTSHASGLGHEGPCDIDRLIKILENRFVVAGAPMPPSSNTSESGGDEANDKIDDNIEAQPALKLEYKRVDEVYVQIVISGGDS